MSEMGQQTTHIKRPIPPQHRKYDDWSQVNIENQIIIEYYPLP